MQFWISLTFALLSAATICHGMAAVTAPVPTPPPSPTPAAQVATAPAVQKFRVTPHDLQILEGTDTLLRCEVSARAGKVQWTKDGFALGFSAVIPGFPRYSVLVDAKQNAYNLQIKNATLEDDAEYQCQVGPAAGNPAIRANAKLSIVAAPSSIVIEGYARNARVEVEERQNLTLHCIAENANPAAEIVWFQGDVPVQSAPIVTVNQTAPKRFTTSSTLHLQPSAEDDYKEFSCEARHKALPPDVPMRAQVQLSVLYPPGAPFFEGYSQGESLNRGQDVQIACRSRGGNPPAQLTWYRNGVAVSSPQRTSGRLSENVYKFTAAAEDNGANLVCEAKNLLAPTPLRAELNLTVLYAPKDVYLSGANQAKVGDSVQMSCVTAPSNPPARISWSMNGRPLVNSTYKTTSSSDGGWVSSSNISLNIDSQSRTFIAVCHALNTELTQNVVGSHTVNVLCRPPSPPLLTGYNDGDILISGSILKLQCSSAGGNPPPTLQWYKNDKRLNAPSKLVDSKITSELSLLLNASDNNAIYKCEVQNAAIDIPLFATKTLGVHFPPETVKISVVPKNLVPGIRAKLICDSSSSNPPAKISWWKDGIPVEGLNLANRPGLWGGSVSTLEMYVNITQDLDGIIYTCQSHNEVLQRSVHETISLDILYPPKFESSQTTTFVGVEGAPFHVELVASGNPMAISYTWTKDGLPISSNSLSGQRLISDGPRLNISRLSRNDAGVYVCEALNSQGTALLEVQVAVEYAPTITAVSEGRSFVVGEPAVLACHIQARPLEAAHVRWSRDGYDLASRTIASFENGTALLQIARVERSDIGNFTCIVDNQRGAPAAQNVLLVVQTAPEIDHSPGFTRYAARLGVRAQLICRALAAPQPSFIWRRNGKDLKMQRRNKFKSVERQVDPLNYESALLIENTSADDYGQYECVVRNALGQASTTLEFSKPTRPDTPLQLRVGNVSDTGVELNWTPGFDGGMQTYFRLRLKQHGEEKYKYVDAKPGYLNISLDGLKPGATYYFSVMAANEAGGSKFMPDIKLTLSKGSQPHSAEYTEKDELPNVMIIGITSAAMVLLVLNAALVAWFVIRRQNKSQSEAEPSNDDVYSKDDNQSVYKLPITALQADVQKKAAASTYLVENVDIIQSTAYPPKYQESSMCTPPYPLCNPDFTRTLPNPKRHSQRNSVTGMIDGMPMRSKDDHMLISNGLYIPSPSPASSLVIKGSYISSPSPAPPADGSYFNMSDKYMSYPPVTY